MLLSNSFCVKACLYQFQKLGVEQCQSTQCPQNQASLLLIVYISYPTGVLYDLRLQLSSHFKHLPAPGLEFHRLLVQLILSCPPHREVQTVNDDMLHCFWAQQVQEVHLNTSNADCWLLKHRKVLVNIAPLGPIHIFKFYNFSKIVFFIMSCVPWMLWLVWGRSAPLLWSYRRLQFCPTSSPG